MSIQIHCPKCEIRLTILDREPGTSMVCPKCDAEITVPASAAAPSGPTPPQPPSSSTSNDASTMTRWANQKLRTSMMGVGLIALLAISVVVAQSIRKPSPVPEVVQNETSPSSTSTTPPPSPSTDNSSTLNTTSTSAPKVEKLPESALPMNDPAPSSKQPPSTEPAAAPQSPVTPEQAPPPRPIAAALPGKPTQYDRFGNPIGPNAGLGRDGEFKGKKLLFWSGYENTGKIFFGPTNPLWKAWERQGFTVIVRFGEFQTEWLRDIDQLWILSTGKFELPLGVPAEAMVAAVDLLPASEIPSGFTAAEYKFIVQATLDMSLSRVHPLNEKAYQAIEKFVQSGKGLCLLSDDDPFVVESNELAKRLYGVAVKGNYIADKIAYVRERKLTPAEIRKFGGQYEVADHPLLTGVNFLYEGITISNVGESEKLEVALKASDGQPLIAISKVTGQRVVIDCAFTQFCHGPTERTSYILKSAGAVRLAQNIAAYLAGK